MPTDGFPTLFLCSECHRYPQIRAKYPVSYFQKEYHAKSVLGGKPLGKDNLHQDI